MPISVTCPKCSAKLKAPDQLAGKKAKCKCGTVVAVPGGAAKSIGAPTSGTNSASRAPAKPAPSPIRAPVAAEPAEVGAGGPPAPRWRPMTARVCPNCQAKMEPDTILCTACGFHTEKGIVI